MLNWLGGGLVAITIAGKVLSVALSCRLGLLQGKYYFLCNQSLQMADIQEITIEFKSLNPIEL